MTQLDRYSLPTPGAVGDALKSSTIDPQRLLDFYVPALFPWDGSRSIVPAPLAFYVRYFKVRTDTEFSELARLYGTGARHGWAWRDTASIDIPSAERLADLWQRHEAPLPKLTDFPANDIYFALETKRYSELGTTVDHDVTFPQPLSECVQHLLSYGWTTEHIKDLGGIYVTAFRHGWMLRAKEDSNG